MIGRDEIGSFCVPTDCPIREAIAAMDRLRKGIILVVDRRGRLVGTVTDGDIRRAVLARLDLGRPIQTLLQRKKGTRYGKPITAPVGASARTCAALLKKHHVLHLPLVDRRERVMGLAMMEDFVPDQAPSLRAVVMAGGRGQRLLPLTKDTPKPLLQVGDKPVMEMVIRRLRDSGVKQFHVTTHHLSDKIVEHFGDGKALDVDISYIKEDRPLGTAGGLHLVKPSKETTLVINGDIVTEVDFRSMLAFHHEHKADLTVAVRQYDLQVPYGVVECDGPWVRRLTEKPLLQQFVSAGIYLLSPAAHRYIPAGEAYNMTDLIDSMIADRRRIVSFPIREYWLDIGQHEDYAKAKRDARRRDRRARGKAG